MSSRATHDAIGFGIGALAVFVSARTQGREPTIWEIVGGGLGGLGGSRGPDLLEPAIHPHHRQFAHSAAVLAAGSSVVFGRAMVLQHELARSAAHEADPLLCVLKQLGSGVAVGLPAGYGSHLVADAMTPRGIPLLGRFGH
jgi:inner membrane protein